MHLLFDFRFRRVLHLEGETNVLTYRHVRIERVVLKDHRDVAISRRHVVHDLAINTYDAARDLFETCDHPHCRGLAAP